MAVTIPTQIRLDQFLLVFYAVLILVYVVAAGTHHHHRAPFAVFWCLISVLWITSSAIKIRSLRRSKQRAISR